MSKSFLKINLTNSSPLLKPAGIPSDWSPGAQAIKGIRRAQREVTLSFREFIERANPGYRFYRHTEVLIEVLQRVADGDLKRVMIYLPPRHSKSETVSRLFTAYFLYRYPHRWVGLGCHTAELAYTLSRNARENYQRAGGQLSQQS